MTDIIRAEGRAGTDQPQIKYKDMGDGTHAMVVYDAASGGAGSSSDVDRETVVGTYRVKTTGTGYSVGDVITATRVLDVSGSTATQVGATVWYNETAGAALAGPPTAAHLTLAGMGALTDAELRASAVPVSDSALLARVPAAVTPGYVPVDSLGVLGAAKSVAMGSASANVALTSTTRRVSIHATVAGFYAVGTGAQTASATTHYIGAGERLDFNIAGSSQIAAIRSGSTDGTLYITELS